MMYKTILHILFFAFTVHVIRSHPQCLDFKSPFLPSQAHQFCSQYSDFGCCTKRDDEHLKNKFENIRSRVRSSTWNRCQGILKELICQNCSPYAAHIYGVEDTRGDNPFPGLCRNYCETLYDNCREIVPFIDAELGNRVNSMSKNAFCERVKNADIDYCYPDLLQNPILTGNVSNTQITSEGCLCLEEYFTDLRNPIFARSPPDGSNRMFIGEQVGLIYVSYPDDRDILPQPFLNITQKVKTTANEGDERGLFQIAFHPEFLSNNKFYLYYSTHLHHSEYLSPEEENRTGIPRDHKVRISEFVVSELDENLGDPLSERVIIEIYEPYWNHNGGELFFGDDGFLYIFVGDGGHREDPFNFAQNKSVLLGKVLRLDVNTGDDNIPYLIPRDNPFRQTAGARPEIYAYGVRNIWRCGKDVGDKITGSGKGRVVCGDVGQDSFEELDLLKRGANYGWNIWEGTECFGSDRDCLVHGSLEEPIHFYPHAVGKSVTGGEFYRGCENPNLNGLYIYGDFMSGRLFGLREDSNTRKWTNKELFMCGSDVCKNGLTGQYEQYIISFGTSLKDELFMLTTGKAKTNKYLGSVLKIVDPARRGNPEICEAGRTNRRLNVVNDNAGTVSDASGTTDPRNSSPSINNLNVRTCSMTSTLICTLMAFRSI
ncbi:hypothetical protein SNE40_010238 [Patella caerulea]|uniref:HHIP-like protein 1 n=1 Tax=Patella caerulea TaxID=87958 RepID=A0AAN8JSY9_PATCE